MSLLDNYKTDFVHVDKTRVSDGEGGFITKWVPQETTFSLIQRHDSTIEAQVAEKAGTASAYTFLHDQALSFDYHDVIRRVSDGVYFRITQASGEDYTPAVSGMNLGMIKAEKWEVTA